MLERYKTQYLDQNIQFIWADRDGTVLESDQTLMDLPLGEPLTAVDPFFATLHSLDGTVGEEHVFNCIHLGHGERQYTTDIKMVFLKEGVLVVVYDLTQHYVEYQQVAQSRNESVIRSELIALKNAELEEREKFKNAFIQNFSHELRNPLTSILSIGNLLADTPLDDEQRKMLQYLNASTVNLKLLLEDTLSISMINSGKMVIHNKVFPLTELGELLAFTYTAKAKAKKIGFSLHMDERLPEYVEGDRLRLFQVLTNLLDNALKYSQKGNISLHILLNQKRANKASLHFEVRDSGQGIPKEEQASIFESFSRLRATQSEEGTGLGLPIVKGLVALMGGEIKVDSEPGKGSVFHFDLTLLSPLRPEPEALPAPKRKTPKGERFKGQKKRILIVEDDEKIQTLLFKGLIAEKCFYVSLINDGGLVMEDLINNSYDLIIMDVNLPNSTGDQLTRLIRELPFPQLQKIPIIGLTSHVYDDRQETYRKAGMDMVFSKPFEMDVLVDTIFRLLK